MTYPVPPYLKTVKRTSELPKSLQKDMEKTYGWALDFMRKYEKRHGQRDS